MRKIVFILFIMSVTLIFLNKSSGVLIPNNAIRIRIIANSNDINDQKIKTEVKNNVNKYLYQKLSGIDNYKEATSVIKASINDIDKIVSKYTNNYLVTYGYNYFPEKKYKGTIYNEGEYESLLIELGNAQGKNFWCVLFPPLCLIDENKENDISYSLYVKELLKKIK